MRYKKKKFYPYETYGTSWFYTPIKGYNITTKFIRLSEQGLLIIYNEYAWNGPSSWFAKDTPAFIVTSLPHDAFYQLMQLGKLPRSCRKAVDKYMVELGLVYGLNKLYAKAAYRVVRAVGWLYTRHKENVDSKIYEVNPDIDS